MSSTDYQPTIPYPTGSGAPPTSNNNGVGTALSGASDALSIYGGLHAGTPLGDAIAAANAAKLGGLLTNSPGLSQAGGALGSGLGLYTGLEQGGVSGYGQAGVDALRLGQYGAQMAGNTALSQGLGDVAGPLGAALSLYNFGKNWQSGATGPDALSGAETGASVGSLVGPVGTVIGGLAGGAIGALSSAFGGGKHDPETDAVNSLIPQYTQAYNQDPTKAQGALSTLTPQQSMETLAGIFDAKNNTPGHSEPIEQTWGRMQEGSFLNDIANQINSGYSAGTIKPGESAADIYSSVINPYITQRTNGQGIVGPDNGVGGVLSGAIQNLIGDYTNGTLDNTTPIGIKGQIDTTLPTYAGMTPEMQASLAASRAAQAQPPSTPANMGSATAAGVVPSSALIQQYLQAQRPGSIQMQTQPSLEPQQPTPIAQRPVMAQGGHMKKKLKSFDDGGSVDDSFSFDNSYSPASSLDLSSIFDNSSPLDLGTFSSSGDLPANYNAQALRDGTQVMDSSNLDSLGLFSNAPSFSDPNLQSASQLDPNLLSQLQQLPSSNLTSSSSGGKGASGALASLLGKLGLSPSTAQTLSQLGLTAASLAPIIASLGGKSSGSGNATQPSTTPPAGYGPPSTPFSVPNYSRQYVGPTTSNWTPEQWYKYGEGPEQTFFSNNQLPAVSGVSPASPTAASSTTAGTPNMQLAPYMGGIPGGPGSSPILKAKGGGALSQSSGMHEGEGYVDDPGYGDGTSDEVNAKLSGGEYVMDGGTVSMLGNGSNDAGARKLDQLREQVRKHAGKSLVKGKQFMKAKEPLAYLGKGK